ncbi:MAG: hypothetical protein KAI69_00695 [Deltaproteobacteria bacterium]|nr:hypothetical protein [Deltaproteobacteria bacterium]MCK5680630.1 hypothetical protein [bacterium]
MINRNKFTLVLLLLWASTFISTAVCQARSTLVKTPDDVFGQVVVLENSVKLLRELSQTDNPWPQIPEQKNKAPRHVLQKTFEVMDKVGRLRKIKQLGPITIPPYPARNITPDEVYDRIVRLNDEVTLLLEHVYGHIYVAASSDIKYLGKTSDDVYRALWAISVSLDPVLGIRGFGPDDVYTQSLRVIEEITFIRQSQLLPLDVAWPERTTGKHPNHALQAAYSLLDKMSLAEANLWIEPIVVPEIPRLVIRPSEVYDILQMVLAESQRIKFRLGLEHVFYTTAIESGKTADDIIRNLVFAERLLPDFKVGDKRIQFNRKDLQKTPNHVFSIASHIYKELQKYKNRRGIQLLPRKTVLVSGLDPKHVFNKTLECLTKVARLRKQMNLGPIVVGDYPIREITANEVYDLALRLDSELAIIYGYGGMTVTPAERDAVIYQEKRPSDVYEKMWQISYLFDTLLGSEGARPDDVFKLMGKNVAEIKLICKYLELDLTSRKPVYIVGQRPHDVYVRGKVVLKELQKVKRWAGMFSGNIILSEKIQTVTPNDVYNQALLIQAEIVSLKVHLGIHLKPKPVAAMVAAKTPSHVYQKMDEAYALLANMLGAESRGDE